MTFGNILVAKGLVTADGVNRALNHQKENGGRLGDSLVALGLLAKEQIDEVINDSPQAPITLADTGIDPAILFELAIKGMYTENFETASQIAEALKIPSNLVNSLMQEAKDRKLVF